MFEPELGREDLGVLGASSSASWASETAVAGRAARPCSLAPVLDHVIINVSDYERSRDFYARALAPLGYEVGMELFPGMGALVLDGKPWFWINEERKPVTQNVHVAFTAKDRPTVDAFHAAAVEAGGTDNGGPGDPRALPPRLLRSLRARPGRNNTRCGGVGRGPRRGHARDLVREARHGVVVRVVVVVRRVEVGVRLVSQHRAASAPG